MEILSNQTTRIYLIGFMGSGKTTVGKYLSQITSRRLLDIDSLIEENAGMTISDIFKNKGEEYFRELEQNILINTFSQENIIISTGGGLPTYKDNIKTINEHGLSICLMARPEVILKRLEKEKNTRPLLQGEDTIKKLNLLIQKRVYYYISSHILIDTSDKSVEEIAEDICVKAGIK